MRGYRLLIVCAVVSCLGFSAQQSEAALAKALGGSGLSGKLSKNKAIRQQQLIADPDDPDTGSTSVLYDPNTVSINSLIFGPGYFGQAVVEVDNDGQRVLQDFGSFVESPLGRETGYVQVRYNTPSEGPSFASGPVVAAAPGVHGQIPVPAGFTTIDQKGPAGVDTHAFLFDYLDVPDSQVAVYRVYADLGNRPSGNTRDFMSGVDDMGQPFTVDAPDISGVTVRGSLDSVPLPPAAYAGGMVLVGMAGFQMLRRRQLALATR